MRFNRRSEDLDEEIRTHLEMAIHDRMDRGETSEEAKRAVLREFGNVGLIKEVTRDIWGWRSIEQFAQDMRYAWRVLLKSPVFTFVAIITLALGIGANTAIFSVVNAVLLKPLPYKNPEQLVMVWSDFQARGGPERELVSPDDFADWRDQNQVFDHLVALLGWGPTLTGQGEPEDLTGATVSYDAFATLGIEPVQGRAFQADEDQPGAARTVVLSDELWRRRFGADAEIVGKPLTLGGESYTVVGVMPPGFKFPLIPKAEIWRTIRPALATSRCGRGCVILRVFARLRTRWICVAQRRGAKPECMSIGIYTCFSITLSG